MEFTLTPELTDRIVFCMEDQNEDYVLDTRTLDLLAVDEIDEEEEPSEKKRSDTFPCRTGRPPTATDSWSASSIVFAIRYTGGGLPRPCPPGAASSGDSRTL